MSLTISGSTSTGVKLNSTAQNPTTISSSGTIKTAGAYGIYGTKTISWTLANYGTVQGQSYGIEIGAAGYVANGGEGASPGAYIAGGKAGVLFKGAGTVENSGTIKGTGTASYGVLLRAGGTIVNGAGSSSALIAGSQDGVLIRAASGTVVNSGSITSTKGTGVSLLYGGSVVNGSGNTGAAIIGSVYGIQIKGGSTADVVNAGVVSASAGVGVSSFGYLLNGGSNAPKALISGSADGVVLKTTAASGNTLINLGTIRSGATAVSMSGASSVLNGSATDITATINGGTEGVSINGSASVTNYGTISGGGAFALGISGVSEVTNFGVIVGSAGAGLTRVGSGTVVNGSSAAPGASIVGMTSGVALNGSGTMPVNFLMNLGGISGRTNGVGITGGGTVENGASADTSSSILGALSGVSINGTATIANYGTISGTSIAGVQVVGYGVIANYGALTSALGTAISIAGGGSIVNGSNSLTSAEISGGYEGVRINLGNTTSSAGVVANWGTITGSNAGVDVTGSMAVYNGSKSDHTARIFGATYGIIVRGNSTVRNFGFISGTSVSGLMLMGNSTIVNYQSITSTLGAGISALGGSSVTNGLGAVISGGSYAIKATAGTATPTNYVENLGTLLGGTSGVEILYGGTVLNGSVSDEAAIIQGGSYGVFVRAGGEVKNYGLISGTLALNATYVFPPVIFPIQPHPTWGGYGVDMSTGGTVINGSNGDQTATIYGIFMGVQIHAAIGTMLNYGTVAGGVVGFYSWNAGLMINGSTADHNALITGGKYGTWNEWPGDTMINFGTVSSSRGTALNTRSGGQAAPCGTIINGSVADTVALSTGYTNGIWTQNGASVLNYATISGSTLYGALLGAGGYLRNGSLVDQSARIDGSVGGVEISGAWVDGGTLAAALNTIVNDATISAAGFGVLINEGGVLRNGASNITGACIEAGSGFGVAIYGSPGLKSDEATVVNYGTILSTSNTGITVAGYGYVINGALFDTTALIEGGVGGIKALGASATIINYGTIAGLSGIGASLVTPCLVENGVGSVGNRVAANALISGGSFGIATGGTSGTNIIVNDGTIAATALTGVGIYLTSGGTVTNGTVTDYRAVIQGGAIGVSARSAITLSNFGSIIGTTGTGAYLKTSGTIINGSSADTSAYIKGGTNGVLIKGGPATLVNFGTIASVSGAGVYLGSGATARITNGASASIVATISGGSYGVEEIGGALSLANDGTISASTGVGVYAKQGATILNGQAGSTAALISGVTRGLFLIGQTATVNNYGSIAATGPVGTGITASAGIVLVNGAAGATRAQISGTAFGVYVTGAAALTRSITNYGTIKGGVGIEFGTPSAAATLVNFGTVIGLGGVAFLGGTGADTVVVHAGAVFTGIVDGGTGGGINVLELASTGGGSASESGVGTAFKDFQVLKLDAGANWSLTGSNTVATLADSGVVTLAGASGAYSSLAVTGSLASAAGTVVIGNYATLDLAAASAGSTISFAGSVGGAGSAKLIIEKSGSFGVNVGSTAYSGPVLQGFVAGDQIDMRDISAKTASIKQTSTLVGGTVMTTVQITDTPPLTKNGPTVASLTFANLGAGNFYLQSDGVTGGLLLTHH